MHRAGIVPWSCDSLCWRVSSARPGHNLDQVDVRAVRRHEAGILFRDCQLRPCRQHNKKGNRSPALQERDESDSVVDE